MVSRWEAFGDWGSTNLRLWRIEDGVPASSAVGPGIVGISDSPADALRAALAPWWSDELPRRITLCGMAGARGGLHEAPYAECPIDAAVWATQAFSSDFDGVPLRIAAGCAMPRTGDPDVMRGEETQIFGAAALRSALALGNHMLVLPGTHSKWVLFADGEIASFCTVPTGEVFALLQRSSLLVSPGSGNRAEFEPGFTEGLDRAYTEPVVLSSLFVARAAQLRLDRSADWANGYLSGLLIGREIAENLARDAQVPISIIGEGTLTALYRRAFQRLGVSADMLDGDACTLAGLRLLNDY